MAFDQQQSGPDPIRSRGAYSGKLQRLYTFAHELIENNAPVQDILDLEEKLHVRYQAYLDSHALALAAEPGQAKKLHEQHAAIEQRHTDELKRLRTHLAQSKAILVQHDQVPHQQMEYAEGLSADAVHHATPKKSANDDGCTQTTYSSSRGGPHRSSTRVKSRSHRSARSLATSSSSFRLSEARIQAEVEKKKLEQLKELQQMRDRKRAVEEEAARRARQMEDEIELTQQQHRVDELNTEVDVRLREDVRLQLGSDYNDSEGEQDDVIRRRPSPPMSVTTMPNRSPPVEAMTPMEPSVRRTITFGDETAKRDNVRQMFRANTEYDRTHPPSKPAALPIVPSDPERPTPGYAPPQSPIGYQPPMLPTLAPVPSASTGYAQQPAATGFEPTTRTTVHATQPAAVNTNAPPSVLSSYVPLPAASASTPPLVTEAYAPPLGTAPYSQPLAATGHSQTQPATVCGTRLAYTQAFDDELQPISLRPTAAEFTPSNARSRVDTPSSSVDLLSRALLEVHLPRPEQLVFDGNPKNFRAFIASFASNITKKVPDPATRLQYLIQHCTGNPKTLVQSCVLLPPDVGFNTALTKLYERYGQNHQIARSYIDGLTSGSAIKASDVNALVQLADDMGVCQIVLSQLRFTSDLDASGTLRSIVKRLPTNIQSKWVECVADIHTHGREATFSDLTAFLEKRARVASTMYGRDLAAADKMKLQNDKPASKPKQWKPQPHSVATLATTTQPPRPAAAKPQAQSASSPSESSPPAGQDCLYCKKSGHRIYRCRAFRQAEAYRALQCC